ncbi:hypothetical protein [Pseudomonas phage vB_Pae_CF165a]|nr:hypothetical protein [Pseudomonas phage vB_Pae_CF165a]
MAWDRNDPLNILALQLDGELRAAADFCYGYNGPAQRAFARHIQGLGKTLDELTVADLKAAAAFADAELNDFARHIQGLGKTLDELTVADLKAAAAFADAELNDLQQRGLI